MFEELKGSIVCVVTSNGDVVGRLLESNQDSLLLDTPKAFMPTEKGMGFAPSVSMGCAEVATARYNMSLVLTVTPAHEEIQKAWRQMTSGIVTP